MLAGAILAGGRSSRMGTDKSILTMPHSQESLLEYVKQQLASICDHKVFVSGKQHRQGIADQIPNCGPLSGIHGVMTEITNRYSDIDELIVAAVDMPDLSIEDFNYLLKMGRKNNSLCCFESCFLPLYIPITIEFNQYLTSQLGGQKDAIVDAPKKRQYSLKTMLDVLHGSQIAPLKTSRLENINTPTQWQQYCAG
ncbi:MAG: molybdenum cofactor guanylyltransferase [Paraglaciecola sp.]|uniref:molybdenum cofactor guanylyltransferase n=1 Tax=Paraglaciecola sp. TaxID=1920173 RepID=UPI00329A5A5D